MITPLPSPLAPSIADSSMPSSSPVALSGAGEGGAKRVCGIPVIVGGEGEAVNGGDEGGGEGLGGKGESCKSGT